VFVEKNRKENKKKTQQLENMNLNFGAKAARYCEYKMHKSKIIMKKHLFYIESKTFPYLGQIYK
jgi:hypothetical protein